MEIIGKVIAFLKALLRVFNVLAWFKGADRPERECGGCPGEKGTNVDNNE